MSTIKDLRDIIRAGGSTEGETGSKGINNLQIFTRDDGKQTLYPNLESAPSSSGGASIVLNAETGDITVTVPKKWKDDERVKSFTDNYNLKILSGNYKNNKDAVYASPFDETKQVKAEEWVKEMDEALKSRISALNTEGPAKADVISAFGGTEKKNSAIQSMSTDNIIVMSLNPKEDKDWLPIPKYMLEAYPQIKKLSTFSTNSNGNFVQKKDFMDNLYNIDGGKITEREALGIATAPSRVLEKIEDLDPEEIASTIAFGNFIKSVDPKRSNWQQFLQAGSAMYEGLQAGLYDWAVGATDLIANAANFSWLNGNTVDTRDFWDFAFGRRNGMDYDSVSDVFSEHASQMAATNKDALDKAKIAYIEGSIAGKAFDTIISLILVGKGTEFLSSKLTPKIIEKGSAKVASDINEAAAYKTTVETLANRGGVFARQAQNMNNMYGGLATNAQAQASILTDINARNSAIYSAYKSYSASAKYRMFFSQTVDQAVELYTKALGGTTALLQSLGPAQLASVVNSASKIAMSATLVDTAISVLGSLVLSAVVGNKDLMTKVLSGKGTSDDAKILLGESAWLTLKGYAFLGLTNVAPSVRKAFFNKYPGLEEAFNNLSDAASQKFMKFTNSIAHPWQKFIKWYLDRQTAIARAKKAVLPNRKVASAEAIKEQALLAEARQYGSNLSREKGSNGVKIVNDAFEKIFGESLITGNETAELTQAQKIDALAKAGVLFTNKELSMSEFEAWKPSYLALQNDLNSWSDIQTNVSQVVKEFSNPNIEPVISQQLSELNNINSRLLDLEKEAGLLSKIEIGANKRILKNDSGFIYAYHSKEAAIYAVRSYEYKILVNEAISKGINPVEYTPAIEAYQRLAESAQKLPEQIREIISKEYIPALSSVEKLIVNRMIDPSIAVYPNAFVMDMRADGKYGKNGNDWLRLVARKELPKGVYNPFSKVVERDNTIALSNFKILDDNDITWVGNGLSELITEYGMARAEKQLLEDAKAATGLTTNEIISGNRTASIRKINEYKSNLKKSINEGVKSFVETSKGTVAIGKERARVQSEFYEQISVTGGIASIDIASLRVVLEEKGIASATSITDQQSFEKFYDGCDQYAKDIIDKAIGERGSGLTKQAPVKFGEYSEFDNLIYDRESLIEYSKTLDNQKQDLLIIRSSREESGEPVDDIDKALSDLEEKISVNNDTIKSIEDKMLNEENWPEFWKRASKEVKDVIRKQLESTSLQTGYGIKGQQLERLNAQVPGFNILDWSLLNREHTNGLVKGGLYSGMEDVESALYIFDIDDLVKVLGYDFSEPVPEMSRLVEKFTNTNGKNAVLPMEIVNDGRKFSINLGGRVKSANDVTTNWKDYLLGLKANGTSKVPVAISYTRKKGGPKNIRSVLEKKLPDLKDDSVIARIDVTDMVRDAFEGYGKIPFFHGQRANYGSIEYNNASMVPTGDSRYTANNGIGDAKWLSPNADYTAPYGDTQIAGNIPTKYFMSDKERVKTLEDIRSKLVEYDKKISDIGKEEIEKSIKPVGKTRFTEKEWNKDSLASKGFFVIKVNGKATYVDLSGTVYGSQPSKTKGVKYLAPTDKKVKLPENFVEKHIVDTEGYKDLGRKKLSRSEKNELAKLEKIFLPSGDVSYRALAEYTKKPVIDISIPMQNMPGVRADGTAFFYYDGVSSKFDDMLNEQLGIQKAGTPSIDDSEEKLAGYLADLNDISVDEILENIYALNNVSYPNEYWAEIWEAENAGEEISEEDLNNAFESVLDEISGKYPNTAEMLQILWLQNGPTTDLGKLTITSKLAEGADKNSGVRSLIVGFLKETDNLPAFDYIDPTEEGRLAWEAIDPTSGNIQDTPAFRAPKGDVTYEDFAASRDASEMSLREELFRAIDFGRYEKLMSLKQSSPDKYEKLLEQVDRANSANNDAVRNSMPVQAAAEEYRKNVTEFENSVVLSNRLSYLTKSVVPKGSLLEFAKNNNIPTGKNIKSDVKEALWNKLLNGESLPEIKDLHIKNIEKDVAAYRSAEEKMIVPAKAADGEIESLENMIAEQEAYLKANTPRTDAIETISKLSYKDRKDLVQKIVSSHKGEYVALYRMQNGAPDQWRPNNRGKKGKFEGNAGEYKGYVWLTSDPDWVEGPERASAGVGDDATDDNIVVIPVKKSDITSYNVTGGEADAMRGLESGQKIVQSRGAPKSKNMSIAMAELVDRTNPDAFSKTEFIINAERNPEIFNDGMDLMLQEYNKQFNSRIYRNRAESTKKEIEVLQDELAKLKESSTAKNATTPSDKVQKINEALLKDIQNKFYEALEKTDLFKNYSGPNALKYEVDLPKISSDIDNAIDDMIDRVLMEKESRLALEGMAQYYGVKPTRVRSEFYILGELLAKSEKKNLDNLLKELSREVVNGLVPPNMVIIQGNIKNITKDIENILRDKLESRFAMAKTQLQTLGENVNSDTTDELLEKYMADLKIAKADPLVVKTTNSDGEIVYEKVSPVIADLYKNRPVYTPMSTPMQILSDFALLKKIFTTDLSPKSFSKQSVSDPALAYVTTGALPGTLQALRSELAAQFGDILQYMPLEDPRRFEIIKQIADRDGISLEEALMQNMIAKASVEIPFTLLNNEILRQANASKYGNKVAIDAQRRTAAQAMNDGLRKISDKLGTPQNIREKYPRIYSGVKAKVDALNRGYSLAQAEAFETYAINNATTNFRQKHTVFNGLRPTVPFLTSGISGAKSFWKMFELDPVGVTSRIFTGFIVPILFFTGEIMSNDELRKKYKDLAENEKNNHIVIAVAGELVAIPVGEELGQYVNIARHVVEKMYDANRFSFYNLMLNDIVNLLPAGDLTGFTDPEMWEPLSGQAPSFLEVVENGTGKMLASTAPPLIQTIFMANTGRDLYTGKKINTGYVTIDEDGNSTIMSYSTSQFAKALANIVGGDPRVIEKVTSGAGGTVLLGVLDTITSAVQFFASGGQEGSLTTGVEKALSDLSKPFALVGYDSLEKRFSSELSKLWDEKEKIISSEEYAAYNKEISMDKNAESRRKKIAKRNDLFNEFQKKVAKLVAGYRDAGGTLDKWKLSKVTSLLTFEDAVRADRTFMHLNTEYSDAYKQAMQTLYDMGITNPDGISSLGYIYTDNEGNPQLAMWNPVQMQIIQRAMSEQGDIHAAHIEAIINDGTQNSLYKQHKEENAAEQPYWDKYYANGKLSDAEWDKIDELRKEFNNKVVIALTNYMNSYGAANVLSNDAVIQYLKGIIEVPSSYETVKGRYISSGGGKLDKASGFIESYLKKIFGVKNYGK